MSMPARDSLRSILVVSVFLVAPGSPSEAASTFDPAPASRLPSLPIGVETAAAVLSTRGLPDGTEVKEWLPARELQEGQVVYYTVRITNPGPQAAHNVVVTKPVPANTRYVAESAAAPGARVTFSVDGGLTFAPPRELKAKERGSAKPVSPERYTHIRWQMRYPLAPGATAYARFRAVFS